MESMWWLVGLIRRVNHKLYHEANARVLGEGEGSIPLWLEAWREASRMERLSPKRPRHHSDTDTSLRLDPL